LAAPLFGCGACGCTLNSDWAGQGLAALAGFRLDLRQDYFSQDQLRGGTSARDRASLPLPNDQEVQQKTLNRNTTLTLDYTSGAAWGLSLTVPFYNRFHSTYAPGDTELSSSQGTGLGDVRVLARYQGEGAAARGVQVGLKLPTGAFHDTFTTGPQAGGSLDRGLQRGSGTTDLLLGAYQFGNLGAAWGYFGSALLQVPTRSREGFRPGNGLNGSLGLRYSGLQGWTPQVQINLRAENREAGPQADVENSGATLTYLSPGVTAQVSPRVQAFLFVQVPVLQRVNGLQLEPRSSVSLGLHGTF
jgi:hypothetical protein